MKRLAIFATITLALVILWACSPEGQTGTIITETKEPASGIGILSASDMIFTITSTGVVSSSANLGDTWSTAGDIGEAPRAGTLHAFDGKLYVGNDTDPGAGSILRSTDLGANWTAVHTVEDSDSEPLVIRGFETFNNALIAVAGTNPSTIGDYDEALILRSADGASWSTVATMPCENAVDLAIGGSTIYAYGTNCDLPGSVTVYSSTDGSTWGEYSADGTWAGIRGLGYFESVLYAIVGADGLHMTTAEDFASPAPVEFTAARGSLFTNSAGTYFFAFDRSKGIERSDDATTFSTVWAPSDSGDWVMQIADGVTYLFGASLVSGVMRSTDANGGTWNSVLSGSFYGVTYDVIDAATATSTPTPPPAIVEVRASQATPDVDWNLRQGAGVNDYYVELWCPTERSLASNVLEVGSCIYAFAADNRCGPLKVTWLDQMYDNTGAPCSTFPISGTVRLYNTGGQPWPTATATVTPTPTGTPPTATPTPTPTATPTGVWPTPTPTRTPRPTSTPFVIATRVYPTVATPGNVWGAQTVTAPTVFVEQTPSPGGQ